MSPLWMSVVRGAGQARTALVVGSTAVVSGLLLVAVSYARLGSIGGYNYGYDYAAGDARLLGPIADPGTRGGAIFAVVVAVVPVVLLLDQCVRLGAAAQRRRYQALAIAGATRRDLRRWGAVETGVPALVGSALGVPVWLLLRLVLGTALAHGGHSTLVPTVTGPGLWALLVVAGVTVYGVLVGRRAAVRATADVRADLRSPKPWGPLVLAVAVVLLIGGLGSAEVLLFAAILLAIVGVMGTTPWLAYVISGRLTRRTSDPAVLLATRRIRADHGAAGRAAAAVGAVGLALGVLGDFVASLFVEQGISDVSYYLVPALLIGALAVLALSVITLSLALHSIESTLARRREMAALVATGVPVTTLDAANRAECRLVTFPVTVGAALLGVLPYLVLDPAGATVLGGLVAVAVAGGGVLLAVRLATMATRPWLRQAVAVGNLRTE